MNLVNQFLVATPQLREPLFLRGVIYICQHDKNGTMGIMINRPTNAKLSEIFSQLDIDYSLSKHAQDPIYAGGPIHPENGGKWNESI